MVRPRWNEHGVPLPKLDHLTLDVERAPTLEDDIDLVVIVRLLTIRFGCDEHVDADLEPGTVFLS
jgi:hypothetical protein